MRPPVKAGAVLASAAALILVTATPCLACSCVPITEAEAFEGADAVFVGRVVSKTGPGMGGGVFSSGDPVAWTFEVDLIQKGEVAQRQGVLSARSSASCGIEFVLGREYQVFADRKDGELSANSCSGTRPTAGEPAFVPDKSSEPHPGTVDTPSGGDAALWVAAGSVAVLLAASGAAVMFLRRRFR